MVFSVKELCKCFRLKYTQPNTYIEVWYNFIDAKDYKKIELSEFKTLWGKQTTQQIIKQVYSTDDIILQLNLLISDIIYNKHYKNRKVENFDY